LNGLRDLDRDIVRSGDTDRDLVRLGDADFNTSRGGVDLTDDFNWDRHSNSNFIRSIDFLSDGFGDLAGDVALDFNRHRHRHVDVVRAGDANRHLDGDVDRDSNSVGLGNLDGDRLGDRDVTVLRDSTLNGDINLLNLLNGSQDFVRLINKNLNRDVVGNSDFHISKLNLRDRDINLSVHYLRNRDLNCSLDNLLLNGGNELLLNGGNELLLKGGGGSIWDNTNGTTNKTSVETTNKTSVKTSVTSVKTSETSVETGGVRDTKATKSCVETKPVVNNTVVENNIACLRRCVLCANREDTP
jgi:hypothetical protein